MKFKAIIKAKGISPFKAKFKPKLNFKNSIKPEKIVNYFIKQFKVKPDKIPVFMQTKKLQKLVQRQTKINLRLLKIKYNSRITYKYFQKVVPTVLMSNSYEIYKNIVKSGMFNSKYAREDLKRIIEGKAHLNLKQLKLFLPGKKLSWIKKTVGIKNKHQRVIFDATWYKDYNWEIIYNENQDAFLSNPQDKNRIAALWYDFLYEQQKKEEVQFEKDFKLS